MNIWENIRGTMSSLFGIGGTSGITVKSNSGAVEFKNSADSALITARALRLQSGAGVNDVATLIDILGLSPNIEFSFDGASAPSPGDNTALFGFCHTSGGSFTAGDVIYDDGSTALASFRLPHVKSVTVASAVTGTVSLIANGVYAKESSGSWVLKGDGGGVETGRLRLIEVPITHSGGDADSTTTLPSGARVIRVDVRVTTAFNGTTPTLAVKAAGSTPLTMLATTGVDLTTTGQYTSDEIFEIDSDSAGAVRADLTLSGASAGAAKVTVVYTTAPLS